MELEDTIFHVLARINAATSISDVWDIFMSAAQNAGLAHGMACFYPQGESVLETTFACRLPEDWLKNYVDRKYQDIDPLLARGLWESRPFAWSIEDWAGERDSRVQAWRHDNIAAGLNSGFTIPDRRDGHLKLIALCGEAKTLDRTQQMALNYAGLEALLRMQELGLRDERFTPVPLSPRERECLKWVAAGKSDMDIGTILGISEKTVNTHIERAKHKMHAQTRAQAIVVAFRLGELS